MKLFHSCNRYLIVAALFLICTTEARAFNDPITGRWLTRDPIEGVLSANLYEYLATNPIDWLDPSGLLPDIIVYRIDPRLFHKGLIDLGHTWIQYPGRDKNNPNSFGWWPTTRKGAKLFGGVKGILKRDDYKRAGEAEHKWKTKSNGRPMGFGPGKGKVAGDATDQEIYDCLEGAANNWISQNKGKWALFGRNCRDLVCAVLSDCGLSLENAPPGTCPEPKPPEPPKPPKPPKPSKPSKPKPSNNEGSTNGGNDSKCPQKAA